MRGKPSPGTHRAHPGGITPAHAGKTQPELTDEWVAKDHPRACGENATYSIFQPDIEGSPPRMRGKLNMVMRFGVVTGITPAHAGKTFLRPKVASVLRDHPRACGENCADDRLRGILQGSPPRMRGKPALKVSSFRFGGITPAHAGKTEVVAEKEGRGRDHPRACGENTSERAYFRG